jgi:hypothetical protein
VKWLSAQRSVVGEDQAPRTPFPVRVLRWWLVLLLIVALLIVVDMAVTREGTVMLFLGWIYFLFRVLPQMTVDQTALIQTAVAFVLLTAGVHVLARSWSAGRWKFRWTLAGVALVVVLFAAGTAMIGAAHQVVWLVTSDEPLQTSVLKYQDYRGSPVYLRHLTRGLHFYADTFDRLPPGGTFAPDGSMRHSWQTRVLPHLYEFGGVDLDRPWNDPVNAPYFKSTPRIFINPRLRGAQLEDDEGFGLSHYAASSHVMGANRGMALKDITDGTSTTLLIGEINGAFPPWGHPVNYRDPVRGINRSPHGFGGPRNAGGATFVMADGSVRFIGEKVSPQVLEALATPAASDDPGVDNGADWR